MTNDVRTTLAGWIAAAATFLLVAGPALARAADAPATARLSSPKSRPASDRVTACDHFAFLRPSLAGGLGGPAKEALKSWDGEKCAAFGPDGSYYQIDANNCVVFRIKDGQARILAGDGVRGGRDGPADQARFDFGVGSYSDADVACDAAGNVYVSEGMAGRLRKISRGPADGAWHVTTVAGGGTRMPKAAGESIPAREMKVGCTSRFALASDGTAYFCTYEGILRVKDGQGTLLADAKSLRAALGKKASLHDWHVGGSHLTPAGMFYWFPGGGPDLLRFDTTAGQAERVAGVGRIAPGLDGPTLLDSGFHTVLIVYAPDASVMYTCGGDESIPRRLRDGRATSLYRDGTFRPHTPPAPGQPAGGGGKDERWKEVAAVQGLDAAGRLYLFTGDYGWGGWVVRFTFGRDDGGGSVKGGR